MRHNLLKGPFWAKSESLLLRLNLQFHRILRKCIVFGTFFIKISMYRTVLLTSSHMIMSDGKVLLVRENQLCALFPEYNSDNSEFYWFLLKCFYQRCSCWRFTLYNRHPYSKRIISPQCQFWWSVYFE